MAIPRSLISPSVTGRRSTSLFWFTTMTKAPEESLCTADSGSSGWSAVPAMMRALAKPPGRILASGLIAIRARSEEHTSELQSLMRISYAVFFLKKKQEKYDSNDYIKNQHLLDDAT